MKTSIGKRLLSFLLAAVMVLSLLPAVASPKAEAQTAAAASNTTATKNEIIALRNYAETLGWPVAVKTTGMGASTDMTGHWMILVERSGGQMYTVNMSSPESMCIENNTPDPFFLYGVTFVTGSGVEDALYSMPQAHVLSFSGTGSSFSVQNYKKQYWQIENRGNGSTDADKNNNYDFVLSSDSSKATKFKLLPNGVGYNLQSTGGIYVRANSHSFQVGPVYFGNPIHFYKFNKYSINLRLSMLDALPYLIDNSEGRFTDAEAHKNLIATMKAAVDAYSVHYDTTESAMSGATKTELERINNQLRSAITALSKSNTGDPNATLRNNINAAKWPFAELIVGDKTNITAGHYMILTERDSATNPMYGVNSDEIPGGWTQDGDAHITRGVTAVKNNGQRVTQRDKDGTTRSVAALSPDNQIPIVNLSGSCDKFTLQHYNGLYWYMTNNTHWYDNRPSPTNWGDFGLSTSATEFKLENDAEHGADGVSYRLFHTINSNSYIIYSNGYTYRTKLAPSNTKGNGYNLEFYRFNEEALALRLALHEGLSYLVEDYATRFDEVAFQAMCEKLNDVRLQFDTDNEVLGMAPSNMTDAKKRTYKKLTEEVLAAIAAVQRTDNEGADFIDIPIEILDFRGDNILFENASKTPYSLSIGGAMASYPQDFPGYNSGGAAAGLTTGILVDGNVVFTKKTVDYIAKHLSAQTALEDAPTNQMNRIFYDLIKSGRLTYNVDDYAKTIKKCVPAIEGGELSWGENGANITTYHDLAYYLLSHMWRSSEDVLKTETLPNGKNYDTTYNMVVPNLNTMRMFKGSNGMYSFLSDKMASAADGYIQNVTDKALTRPVGDPKFQPINNKGFEDPNLYGTATEGKYDNMNNNLFTLHAYGSFIYTEEADLTFSFTGDDDVYFFVNDQLVCDIGGMHGAITRDNVKLNDFVTTLHLTDGQICHFDMFYAERHTTGINLNFSTNIQLMDESVITDKMQYEGTTGKPLMDGAVVPTGTELVYSFGLTNRRNLPALDLLLTDSKLGVTLDGHREMGSITLNAPDSEDITRYATDLTVVYSGYDRITKTVSTETEQSLSFEQMMDLIQDAVVVKDPPYTASPLKSGVYSYKVESADKLLTLLQLGLPAYCKLTIRGFRHRMEEGQFANSLSTRCIPVNLIPDASGVPVIEYGEPINGTAGCKCQALSIALVSANDPYAVIMDYGKAVEVDLSSLKDTFTVPQGLSLSYVGSTFNGEHNTIKTKQPIFTPVGEIVEDETALYTMTSAQRLRFATKCFMEESRSFYAVYYVTAPNITGFTPYYIMKAVAFLPATMIYYEAENFLSEISYTEKRTVTSDTGESHAVFYEEWKQEGAANDIKEEGISAADDLQMFKPVGQDHPYGYDPSYGDDTLLSNGKSLYVEGAGVIVPNASNNANYTQIVFSFLGTGFDIISRTNKDQGSIRVSVYTDEEMTADKLERSVTVNNYGELDLYQIPVVSIHKLTHGRHYVSVEVNDKLSIPILGLYYGNQFYFDAIRIYDPIDTRGQNVSGDRQIAYDAYCADREVYPVVKEIRDSLLDGAKTEGLTSLTKGAMFVDAEEYTTPTVGTENTTPPTVLISDHLAISAATYEKAGPKNEVYLSPGQAVAFKLELADGKTPVRVDVGAKTIMGDEVTLAAGFVGSATTEESTLQTLSSIVEKLTSSTAMYYSLDTAGLSADQDHYLVIYNALDANYSAEDPGNVLSVTDLKVCYAIEPVTAMEDMKLTAEPYFFAVDNRTLEAAAVFMRAFPETPILDRNTTIMHSLNLASDISINYIVAKSDLEGYRSFYLECLQPRYEGNTYVGDTILKLEPVDRGAFYYFTLDGLTATQMNDTIQATLRMEKESKTYYSETDTYSIAQYAYNRLAKETTTAELKTLCADLLRYGARAQSYKGYRVDSPADQAMTDGHKSHLSDIEAVTFGNYNTVREDLAAPTVTWVGKALVLDSRVTVRFVINAAGYNGSVEELELRIRYRDLSGAEQTCVLTEAVVYGGAEGRYAFDFAGLNAAELRSVIEAAVYAGDAQVSDTLIYSADTYGNNKTGTLLDLCKALFAYADSAEDFFA